jgi:hypothetical protein
MMKKWRISLTVLFALLWALVLYAHLMGLPYSRKIPAESMRPNTGFAFYAAVGEAYPDMGLLRLADNQSAPRNSRAGLFENALPLGPAHAVHEEIRKNGGGRFSDWDGTLYFSASDNTDPRVNGREYELRDTMFLAKQPTRQLSWILGGVLLAIWLGSLLPRRIPGSVNSLSLPKMPVSIPGILKRPGLGKAVLLLLVFAGGGLVLYRWATTGYGVAFWLAITSALILGLLAIRQILAVVATLAGVQWKLSWFSNLALILFSAGICVLSFEAYLAVLETAALQPKTDSSKGQSQTGQQEPVKNPQDQYEPTSRAQRTKTAIQAAGLNPDSIIASVDGQLEIGGVVALPSGLRDEMKRRRELLSLPEEWQRKNVSVPNTRWAYAWHGVMHVHDENKFRRLNGPFPEKRADTMRIMVVGDSMTYGAGIQPEWTYTSQLERALQRDYKVELFNLGVNGDQSEDVAKSVERMLPILKPDLVIYGFCYNDFLPSGIGQYENSNVFPLPKEFKDFMRKRTRLARVVDDGYEALLLRLGVSRDFYDDILKDLRGYQSRFANDVMQMSKTCRTAGLPPVVSMPLDQNVVVGGRGHSISQLGEKLMRDAGFDVISLDGYYKRYNGRTFRVSRWEGHPDEEANAIFASMLYDHLRVRPDIQRYAKSGASRR